MSPPLAYPLRLAVQARMEVDMSPPPLDASIVMLMRACEDLMSDHLTRETLNSEELGILRLYTEEVALRFLA